MSRRARLEDEKLRQQNQELKVEEDKIKLQKERIYAPLVWKRLASGIKIEDLKPKYFDEVLRILTEHYVPEEVLCRNSNMKDDPTSLESFITRVMFNLKDTTSLIALDEVNEDAIAGLLVLKVVHKDDFGRAFSRAQLVDGEAHKKCVTFSNYLNRKADVFSELNCEIFLRYYLLCIKPEYRKKGLGFQLMLTGVDVARTLHIPVIMGLFSCFSLQKCAKRLGMKVVYEINYVEWRDKGKEMIFDEPGVGNYTCAVMGCEVLPAPAPDPNMVAQTEEEKKAMKMTRDDKRKQKIKNATKK